MEIQREDDRLEKQFETNISIAKRGHTQSRSTAKAVTESFEDRSLHQLLLMRCTDMAKCAYVLL